MRKMASNLFGEIIYDTLIAPYIDYLEFGTKYYEGAKGFIAITTVDEIKMMIYSKVNGQFDQKKFSNTKQEVSNLKPTQRTNSRLLKVIGGEALVSK